MSDTTSNEQKVYNLTQELLNLKADKKNRARRTTKKLNVWKLKSKTCIKKKELQRKENLMSDSVILPFNGDVQPNQHVYHAVMQENLAHLETQIKEYGAKLEQAKDTVNKASAYLNEVNSYHMVTVNVYNTMKAAYEKIKQLENAVPRTNV